MRLGLRFELQPEVRSIHNVGQNRLCLCMKKGIVSLRFAIKANKDEMKASLAFLGTLALAGKIDIC